MVRLDWNVSLGLLILRELLSSNNTMFSRNRRLEENHFASPEA